MVDNKDSSDKQQIVSVVDSHKPTSTSATPKQQSSVDVDRGLAGVYVDGNGQIPDMTKLEKTQRSKWKTALYLLIAVLAILLTAAVAGFLFFTNWGDDSFTNERISLKIDPPITIVSGQEAVYTIMITNKEKVNLYNLELKLEYPDNFQYLEAMPEAENEDNNVWTFNVLRVGETQKIEIVGKVIAPVDSVQTFKGHLAFKPANLNAEFKQSAIVDIKVSSSVISLNINGPDKALANNEVEYIVSYKNLSQETFTDLQVVADYPEGFIYASAEPEPMEGFSNTWSIDSIESDQGGEIKIKGNYSAVTEPGTKDFKVRIQIKKDADYYPQSEQVLNTEVVKDQLTMQLIINGSAQDQPVAFGDLLTYSLSYKNTGESNLENIKIKANFDSQILDLNSIQDEAGGAVEGNSIVWDGKNIPLLLRLGPGEEGQINWQIKIKDAAAVVNQDIAKFSVSSYAEAAIEQVGGSQAVIRTKTITNLVSSDLGVNAGARYYSEDNIPLGLGPIEPKVGEVSTYNIKLELINNLNDVKDVRLVASLPANVEWADKETHNTGDLVYDSKARQLTWYISRLVKSAQNTEATFNVSIEPQSSDLGRVLILVSNLSLSAKDSQTGAEINKGLKAITTAFTDPILGSVSGIVE
ncbi:MAG TPA: hypothetical protein PK896_02110 [bacterium]|nr:hypothetical protein [bacterium]